ncbi:MAG: thiamine pyrophosphate-dependent enzyme, partial [Acutalibacteraceae bacterium]
VAEMINQSERPAIYFGGGVAAADAGAALLALMNKASIPATRTLMASGVLSYDEPKNLGLLGMHGSRTANLVVDEADLVLALGTRFSDRVALNTDAFARNAKIVQIDIDQSEINKNVEVSLGVVGDIGHALERLLPMVEEKYHPQWWRIIADSQAADYMPEDDDTVLKPHQVIGKICELAGEDSIIATDVGQHQMWAAQYCKRVKTRSFLTSGGLGTMGYGYGAALGAQVAFPDRPVIHITGDGSFHMNMNECCTAVSYNLPVITVIMNNTVLGMVRQWQAAFYGQRYYSTSPERKTNYQKVAEGFGAKGYRVQNLQEFEQAFRQALAERRPCWIECPIDKDERVLPMIPPGQTIDDIIMD